jgi:hypothetical protein
MKAVQAHWSAQRHPLVGRKTVKQADIGGGGARICWRREEKAKETGYTRKKTPWNSSF